jgi:2-amino-4-hydroxy-6-hydroxymethyldihydropteridine diphosphokinase
METSIFLALGSNLGDREYNLNRAREQIAAHCGKLVATSSLYKTAAWGKTNQPDFLNQVIEIESLLTPFELLASVLTIEKGMGRIRKEMWGERIVDIDILFFNKRTINIEGLTIPHPELTRRRFVLVPLCELAPYFIHPLIHKTMQQLLDECEDVLPVMKII